MLHFPTFAGNWLRLADPKLAILIGVPAVVGSLLIHGDNFVDERLSAFEWMNSCDGINSKILESAAQKNRDDEAFRKRIIKISRSNDEDARRLLVDLYNMKTEEFEKTREAIERLRNEVCSFEALGAAGRVSKSHQ
ncbi:hypothetical protein [Methylobacterium oxalidis]|uniref:Uncharacterized protein n=1 Tax=Methylobacterium oxalidis TaxID=944322 RepID=A0A512J3C3_9HYPH|nr:hypothetical protein [Methylobacterium oxalidis]GEP04454.1 hypothetical protein MOX02_24920 [Methylobacterium oxalidis]GLS62826.1 hypothetical protein GCM10007888_12070 [Methylobacterium oxalidis]